MKDIICPKCSDILKPSDSWDFMDRVKLNELQKDLSKVCDYLEGEQEHYEESGRPRNHIWLSVKRISQRLRNNKLTF